MAKSKGTIKVQFPKSTPVSKSIPKSLNKSDVYVDESALNLKPSVDIRFLNQSSKCFKHAFQTFKNNKKATNDFYDDFQKFLFDFSSLENIEVAKKRYASHKNGSKISKSNSFVKSIVDSLPEDVGKYVEDELDHLHLKANGKGKAVVFGFTHISTFYIVGLDPIHEFA
ncbi:hypothetical protein [Erysipelothrix anatis]|uniref:hypothetical protein n=1 Tax=Erysipelothrix anatis TaxID=2683713 RepID=UPI00135C3A92|nr:hypothetical protein [Erysipelothrix anatis]